MQTTDIPGLDLSWNPIAMRCTPVSAGCANCWHLRMATRLAGNPVFPDDVGLAYQGYGPPVLIEKELEAPLRRRKPARIGVQYMGDLFHESVHDEWAQLLVALASMAPWHTFVILTKRPEMRDLLSSPDDLEVARSMAMEEYGHHVFDVHARRRDDGRATSWMFEENGLPPNLWLGVSVEDQQTADERIPLLLDIPAAVRWVSYEPALAPTVFDADWLAPRCSGCNCHTPRHETCFHNCGLPVLDTPTLDWLVCGPETGPGARPMDIRWAQSARDQCLRAGVPFWYKPGPLDGRVHEETP
jgi:protein gp37